MSRPSTRWEGRLIGVLAAVGIAGTLLDHAFQAFLLRRAAPAGNRAISVGLDGIDYAALSSIPGATTAAWIALAIGLAGSALPWLAAWSIGSALRAHAPESNAVANAFRRLALAFVGFIGSRLLATAIVYAAWSAADAPPSLDIASPGLLVGTIAAVLAWRVSRITARAVEQAREIEAIV